MNLVAAHTTGWSVSRTRCSVQRCCAEPGPRRPTVYVERWAPALQRIAKKRCSASGARDPLQSRQTRLRDLAARSARAVLSVSPHRKRKGAGKAGRRLAPEVRTRRTHAGLTTGDAGRPAFPAQWCYGLWRALPGERCTIAPVALRLIDARARSGRHITASLDARTPGARTTRFCRPRTSLPGHSRARACSPPTPKRNAVTAPCRTADRDGSRGLPALPSPHAPALPRPSHPGSRIVTIAKRPFGGPGWNAV